EFYSHRMTGVQDAIHIHVNGESRAWLSGATVAELLQDLDIRTERVAVELNLEILDRAVFDQRLLKDGDRVEILSFIGGGSL
ncbi:MAG: sulfur carrier protein ThiS, partial [Nitrospirota bacterium]